MKYHGTMTKHIKNTALFVAALVVVSAVFAQANERAVSDAYDEFRAFLDEGDFEHAIPAGRTVLRLAEQTFGDHAIEVSYPVLDLALAFRNAGLYGTSETYYQRAIGIIEGEQGLYSPRLIAALVGLGETYLEAGQYDEAKDAFRRAQHVVHRKDGVISLQQIPILDNLTDTYISSGEILDADREQRLAYRVTRLKYGDDDPRTVPAMLKLAEWFRDSSQYPNAATMYKRAVVVLENAYGTGDPSTIEPLRGLADTRGEHLRRLPPGVPDRGVPVSESTKALERVLAIVDSEDNRDSDQELRSVLDLADWYLIRGKTNKAYELYFRGWDLLGDFSEPDDLRAQIFGNPVKLYYNAQNLGALLPSWKRFQYAELYIDVSFTVTVKGKTDDIVLAETNSPVEIRREVKRAVQRAVYRPRFVDRQPVETTDVSFRQVITLNQSASDESDFTRIR